MQPFFLNALRLRFYFEDHPCYTNRFKLTPPLMSLRVDAHKSHLTPRPHWASMCNQSQCLLRARFEQRSIPSRLWCMLSRAGFYHKRWGLTVFFSILDLSTKKLPVFCISLWKSVLFPRKTSMVVILVIGILGSGYIKYMPGREISGLPKKKSMPESMYISP